MTVPRRGTDKRDMGCSTGMRIADLHAVPRRGHFGHLAMARHVRDLPRKIHHPSSFRETLNNIDWPSKPGLTADSQRTELVTLLDRAKAAGMNAIIFHARPAADAVYRSPYEPWGAMLTGRQGGDPGWDPLAVAVAEAHRRG